MAHDAVSLRDSIKASFSSTDLSTYECRIFKCLHIKFSDIFCIKMTQNTLRSTIYQSKQKLANPYLCRVTQPHSCRISKLKVLNLRDSIVREASCDVSNTL